MPSLLDSPLKSNVWNLVKACDVLIPQGIKMFPIFLHSGFLRSWFESVYRKMNLRPQTVSRHLDTLEACTTHPK